MSIEMRGIGFLRALIEGATARYDGVRYVLPDGRSLGREIVRDLIARGALAGDAHSCRANAETAAWLRRNRPGASRHVHPHLRLVRQADGTTLDRNESPLQQLVASDPAFLTEEQVAAGERLRSLVARAQMLPKMTASYAETHLGGQTGAAGDVSDMGLDARATLRRLYGRVPRDLMDLLVDACGMLKDLSSIERDRMLPRHAGKHLLRIGLENLVLVWGMRTGTPSRTTI